MAFSLVKSVKVPILIFAFQFLSLLIVLGVVSFSVIILSYPFINAFITYVISNKQKIKNMLISLLFAVIPFGVLFVYSVVNGSYLGEAMAISGLIYGFIAPDIFCMIFIGFKAMISKFDNSKTAPSAAGNRDNNPEEGFVS